MKKVEIRYRPGKSNAIADALFRSPQGPTPTEEQRENDVQVAALRCSEGSEVQTTVTDLLQTDLQLVYCRSWRGAAERSIHTGGHQFP